MNTEFWIDMGDLGDQKVGIEFDYSPAQRGCMYLSNGDPGYPSEPEELDVCSVVWNGLDVTNHIHDMGALEDALLDHMRDLARDLAREAIEEAQEARWEARREDEMHA